MNTRDIKDAALLLFIAALAFIAASDSVFPIVVIVMKTIFYMFGSLMAILGASILIRTVFGKNNQEKNAD